MYETVHKDDAQEFFSPSQMAERIKDCLRQLPQDKRVMFTKTATGFWSEKEQNLRIWGGLFAGAELKHFDSNSGGDMIFNCSGTKEEMAELVTLLEKEVLSRYWKWVPDCAAGSGMAIWLGRGFPPHNPRLAN